MVVGGIKRKQLEFEGFFHRPHVENMRGEHAWASGVVVASKEVGGRGVEEVLPLALTPLPSPPLLGSSLLSPPSSTVMALYHEESPS